jgi:transcriptional regulator GlxA family with amidase domain
MGRRPARAQARDDRSPARGLRPRSPAHVHLHRGVDPTVLYVDDGQVLTSAGTAAGVDLGLHVLRLHYGATVANQVARRIVMPPYPDGGQAQYIETLVLENLKTTPR